jgi:DNA-directed RNA polymerase specialized sigma24 family protein
MPGDLERYAAIPDPFQRLAAVTRRLAETGSEINDLSRLRRDLVVDLHDQGYSHAQIAEAAGLSRGRIFQILRGIC